MLYFKTNRAELNTQRQINDFLQNDLQQWQLSEWDLWAKSGSAEGELYWEEQERTEQLLLTSAFHRSFKQS